MSEIAHESGCSGSNCRPMLAFTDTHRPYVNIQYSATKPLRASIRTYCKKSFYTLVKGGYYTRVLNNITPLYISTRYYSKVTVVYDYYLFPFNDPIQL